MTYSHKEQCPHCGSRRVGKYGSCADCEEAAERRGYEQRKAREAFLRRQGYDEEYIRTH